jgi:hypothetical protein
VVKCAGHRDETVSKPRNRIPIKQCVQANLQIPFASLQGIDLLFEEDALIDMAFAAARIRVISKVSVKVVRDLSSAAQPESQKEMIRRCSGIVLCSCLWFRVVPRAGMLIRGRGPWP